jgi:hypothetical protein
MVCGLLTWGSQCRTEWSAWPSKDEIARAMWTIQFNKNQEGIKWSNEKQPHAGRTLHQTSSCLSSILRRGRLYQRLQNK